jgi:Putative addiction module component
MAGLRVLRETMQSIEQLTKEILSLPSVSRALLADKLVESLEFDTDPTIQAAWVTEAKRRRDEVRNGSVTPIPGEEALAQVRQLLE